MSTADGMRLLMAEADKAMAKWVPEFERQMMRHVIHGVAVICFSWRVVGPQRARILRKRGELVVPTTRSGGTKKAFMWHMKKEANKMLAIR